MDTRDKNEFIADGATVIGNVELGKDVGIWYHATVRGDSNSIVIGEGTNIQDNAVVHVDKGHAVKIGKFVTVGHSAIVHGCTVGDNTLIGMGSILLNDVKVGDNCIVGAGSLLTRGMEVPDGSLVMGSPAVVKRKLTQEEIASNMQNAMEYIEEKNSYLNL